MARIFVALISLCFAPFSVADGWTEIVGKNKLGETITWTVDPIELSDSNGERRLSTTITITNKSGKVTEHHDQVCSFTGENSKYYFSCESSGTSPLAGAKYLARPDRKRECGGTYYLLKRGGGRKTPATMYKEPWEC